MGRGDAVSLLEGREQREGKATAYVCVDFTCRRPVTEPKDLQTLIERL